MGPVWQLFSREESCPCREQNARRAARRYADSAIESQVCASRKQTASRSERRSVASGISGARRDRPKRERGHVTCVGAIASVWDSESEPALRGHVLPPSSRLFLQAAPCVTLPWRSDPGDFTLQMTASSSWKEITRYIDMPISGTFPRKHPIDLST
jgi:hypothetical protein